MSNILGLDLGPNSIGWAIIDDKAQSIIGTGVRIFQEGVASMGTGSEETWNVQRRMARGARRNNARHRQRRNQLRQCLQQAGMMPLEEPGLTEYFAIDPYQVRERGLDQQLTLHEYGRALYHMMLRRGFKSNRKAGDSEDGKIFKGRESITGITATAEEIAASGARTLGEYLASIDSGAERKRARYTLRSMYIEEFDKLWQEQMAYHPGTLTDELYQAIHHAIFYQRPLRSQKHTIGYCTLEPSKRRAPSSSFVFQIYRILEQVSRLAVTTGGRHGDFLNERERELLIDALRTSEKKTFPQIRTLLGLNRNAHFNLQDQKYLKGDTTRFKLEMVFGKRVWAAFSPDDQEKIWHTIHFSDDPEWLHDYARDHWGLEEKQLAQLAKTALEPGYSSLSKKAMVKIIPFLEEGKVYSEAAKEAGYHHSRIDRYGRDRDKLPAPKDIRNPVVKQSLSELRRVINLLLETYGKPDIIRLEMGRELRMPKKVRVKMLSENKKREANRERITGILQDELGFHQPSHEDIRRYMLWEECQQICPYTGKEISLAAVYNGDFEIEHIIPYSRSLDDSMANKTLCWKPENQRKGNETPYELYHGDPERYQEVMDRVKKYLPRKLRKFQQKEIEKEFHNSQIVDNSYIAKEAHAYVATICDHVQVSIGRSTAHLRYYWGLHRILSPDLDIKNRDDHRHHAVDALVVANMSPGMLKTLSTYRGKGGDHRKIRFPFPWESFREDANASINKILVSHRIKARPRGKLHEETYYGEVTLQNGETAFAVRKPLESLTPAMVERIIDGGTRRAVINRLAEYGIDIETKPSRLPKEVFKEPLCLPGTQTPIKSVRVAYQSKNMYQLYPDRNLWVEPGSNHHAVVFRTSDGKQIGKVVSLLEVVKRIRRGEPVIDKKAPSKPPGAKFLYSLTRNDMFLDQVATSELDWERPDLAEAVCGQLYRIQKMAVTGRLGLRQHTVSRVDIKNGFLDPYISTLKGIKVLVDPIGRITPADE